ncbi:MAG: IS200/IS605 family element transposase accessory protein TnpB [Candidatus Aenigmarchaeota archaeon]|nr:IS200/IS605 family element transposase accessory protein TnpB [Candidatus Aenigmarchaeota archaeon]
MRAFRYRLYPSKMQTKTIDMAIENCRQLYNQMLSLKVEKYKDDKTSLKRNDLYSLVKGNRLMYSQVSQNVGERVSSVFNHFFKTKGGFPRFKKYGRYRSITYPQAKEKWIGNKLRLPMIGDISMKYHRPVEGKPKTMTVKKMPSGKYFATICCETTREKTVDRFLDKKIGIDLGLNHFIATSDGRFFEHPKPLKKLEEKRKLLSKRLSRKQGTFNKGKARVKLARLYERITYIRQDYSWKLVNYLTRNYGTVFFEDLRIKNMLKNHSLAKSIADVSWGDFVQKLLFKAESAGTKAIKVNPRNTSQICSNCGKMNTMALSDRVYKCGCGLFVDRDYNSAMVILLRGIGSERSESTPLEMEPLLSKKASAVSELGSLNFDGKQFT